MSKSNSEGHPPYGCATMVVAVFVGLLFYPLAGVLLFLFGFVVNVFHTVCMARTKND